MLLPVELPVDKLFSHTEKMLKLHGNVPGSAVDPLKSQWFIRHALKYLSDSLVDLHQKVLQVDNDTLANLSRTSTYAYTKHVKASFELFKTAIEDYYVFLKRALVTKVNFEPMVDAIVTRVVRMRLIAITVAENHSPEEAKMLDGIRIETLGRLQEMVNFVITQVAALSK